MLQIDSFVYYLVYPEVGLDGLKQAYLIKWYVEDLNSQQVFDTMSGLLEEVKCVRSIIQVWKT